MYDMACNTNRISGQPRDMSETPGWAFLVNHARAPAAVAGSRDARTRDVRETSRPARGADTVARRTDATARHAGRSTSIRASDEERP